MYPERVNTELDRIWRYVIYVVYVINKTGIDSWLDDCFITAEQPEKSRLYANVAIRRDLSIYKTLFIPMNGHQNPKKQYQMFLQVTTIQ